MLRKLLIVDKVELLTVYIEFCRTLSSVNLQIAHWFRLPVDQMILDQSTLFIIWKTDTNFQVSNILRKKTLIAIVS